MKMFTRAPLTASTGKSRRGFTLIELLVVIGIIALLIGLLLPSVGRARKSGWLVKSLANTRSLVTANFSYQNDQKGFSAMGAIRGAGRGSIPDRAGTPGWAEMAGVASWSFGGKENDAFWVSNTGGAFDYESADRPLNRYVNDSIIYPYADQPTTRMPANATERQNFKLEWYKDPSDKLSYQQDWGYNATVQGGRAPRGARNALTGEVISSYDDVGTSYHMNFKWFDFIRAQPPVVSFGASWFKGMRYFRGAEGISPSRFVFLHDQYTDIIANSPSAQYQTRNGYGDLNRSIMGFMDGHAAYKGVTPGNVPASFSNSQYTLVFEFLGAN